MSENHTRRMRAYLPIALLTSVSLAAIGLTSGALEPARRTGPRTIEMRAFQFGFEPSRITVRVGEEVLFRVTSEDVTHGFYIDGTAVKESLDPHTPKVIGPLTFDRPAKLKIRCAHFCGPLHPFMVADLIVESGFVNTFGALVALAALVLLGMLVYLWRYQPTDSLLGCSLRGSIDLLKVRFIGKPLQKFLHWRPSHFWILLPNLWIFLAIFTSAAVGNPLGALNFSIVIIWILWFCLVEFMIFFGGRLWCLMCPLPILGEWIARKRVALAPRIPLRFFSLNRKWPSWLNHSWIASIGFLLMSLPIVWLVTRPSITGILFLTLMFVALIVPLLFDGGHRRFCDHLCPAFYIGYHASTSAIAVEPRDEAVCKRHQVKECLRGNARGFGCPWSIYPGGKGPTGASSSIHCNLCHECLKTCSLDNMTLKLRMPGKEVVDKLRSRPDEAWQGFIRLSLALFYEFVFFGAVFWIKDWGNLSNTAPSNLGTLSVLAPTGGAVVNFLKWCLLVSSISLIVLPAIFFGFVALAHWKNGAVDKPGLKKVFLSLSYALSPYGQLLWMSFGLSLLVVNWAYPLKALASDPLGWGWNILGLGSMAHSAHALYAPAGAQHLPLIQYVFSVFALAMGVQVTFLLALKLYQKQMRPALVTTAIMSLFYFAATVTFMGVFLG